MTLQLTVRALAPARAGVALATLAAVLSGCGGGGDNPLGNPATIQNGAAAGGTKLSFAYFQKCVNSVLLAQLQVRHNGVTNTNSCAGSGCHDSVAGTGGALRVVPNTQTVDLSDPANTGDVIRASDMYKNFYSSQGVTLPGTPAQSRLLTKPLLSGVLHGGGLIFDGVDDPNAKLLRYWIEHPMPQGQDEFSSAAALFDPTGACKIQ